MLFYGKTLCCIFRTLVFMMFSLCCRSGVRRSTSSRNTSSPATSSGCSAKVSTFTRSSSLPSPAASRYTSTAAPLAGVSIARSFSSTYVLRTSVPQVRAYCMDRVSNLLAGSSSSSSLYNTKSLNKYMLEHECSKKAKK